MKLKLIKRTAFLIVKLHEKFQYIETGDLEVECFLPTLTFCRYDEFYIFPGVAIEVDADGEVWLRSNVGTIPVKMGEEQSLLMLQDPENGFNFVQYRSPIETTMDFLFMHKIRRKDLVGKFMMYGDRRRSLYPKMDQPIIKTTMFLDEQVAYAVADGVNASVILYKTPDAITEVFCNWLLEQDGIKEKFNTEEEKHD